MPEDIAFILSKSGVDQCRGGKVNSLTRKECRWMDGFSTLYSRYTENEVKDQSVAGIDPAQCTHESAHTRV